MNYSYFYKYYQMIYSNIYDFILVNIIKVVVFINDVITKISVIYQTEEEIIQLRMEISNYKIMLKYQYEDFIKEKNKRIDGDNKLLELRQLYLRKLLEDDNNEKIIKLENIKDKYQKLNLELIKKIDELNKTIIINKNKLIKLEKVIIDKTQKYNDLEIELKTNLDELKQDYLKIIKSLDVSINESSNLTLALKYANDKYNDLEIEYKKHLDDYFNLKLLVDNQIIYTNNKRLRFKLKDAYSCIRNLRNQRNKIIEYYKNLEI